MSTLIVSSTINIIFVKSLRSLKIIKRLTQGNEGGRIKIIEVQRIVKRVDMLWILKPFLHLCIFVGQ